MKPEAQKIKTIFKKWVNFLKLYAKNVQFFFLFIHFNQSSQNSTPTDDVHVVNIHGSPSSGNIVTFGTNSGESKNFVNHFKV